MKNSRRFPARAVEQIPYRPIYRVTKLRFIEIPRERRSNVPLTEEQLTEMRGGRTAEEYRWYLIRKFGDK